MEEVSLVFRAERGTSSHASSPPGEVAGVKPSAQSLVSPAWGDVSVSAGGEFCSLSAVSGLVGGFSLLSPPFSLSSFSPGRRGELCRACSRVEDLVFFPCAFQSISFSLLGG